MVQGMPYDDVTIDGENIALFKYPMGGSQIAYVGLRHNGAPFGQDFIAPANGKWDDILIKFPSWKQGAGVIHPFKCSAGSSMSVTDLVANDAAMQKLKSFDKVFENLQVLGEVTNSFGHLPLPSLLFEDAAAMEMA